MIRRGNNNRRRFLLRTFPWYVLLLPAFFVLHGWKENYYELSPGAIIPLAGVHTGVAIGLLFIFLAVFRDLRRAGIFTFALLSVNFFFGAMQDNLLRTAPLFFTRYSVLLPAILIVLVLLFIWPKRTAGSVAA